MHFKINSISAFDLERIAYQGINNKLFDAAVEFLEKLVEKAEKEKKMGITSIDFLFKHKVDDQAYKTHMKVIKKIHDDMLDRQGQFSINRRCNQYPFDPELRKKKKFKRGYNATIILTRKAMRSLKSDNPEKYQISTQLQVDKLCRGGQLRVIKIANHSLRYTYILSKDIMIQISYYYNIALECNPE